MALSRFVITSAVSLPAGTPTAVSNGFGLVSWAGAGSGSTLQWSDGMPATFVKGQVIYADSSAPGATPTGAQQLYTALNALGAIRPYVQGQDDTGHAALAN